MKIGVLVSRSGPAGLWAPASDAGAMLAAAEINASGGLFGSRIELVVADSGWTEAEAMAASGILVDIEGVDAVVGMHPSNVRDAIRRRLGGQVPYVYTPQYEGGKHGPGMLATGGIDNEVLGPAVAWLTERRRAQRFVLVGSDYIWPRVAHGWAHGLVRSAGATVVGEMILPFGVEDYAPVLDRIRALCPDVVVMALLGSEAVRFNRAFSEAGLSATALRLGLAVDETVLYGIGADHSENLYATLNYFSRIRSADNDRFLEAYHQCFGERAPPVTIFTQSCYDGVHVIANLARAVGRTSGAALAGGVRRPVARDAVRNRLGGSPMGQRLSVYLAAAQGIDYRVVARH